MDAAAELGFSVRIEELEKAVIALQKISSESKSANASAKSIGASMSAAAKVFAGAVAGMNQGILTLVTSSKSATAEQIAAAKQASEYANKIYEAALAQEKLVTSVNKATNAVKKEAAAIKTENSLISVLTDKNKTAAKISSFQQGESDKQTNRFNVGNIAAQFQDIGVTAAMGMNPLTIGLQQGTQLSAVLNMMAQNGEKGAGVIKALGEAFKSIINPLSLTTITLTTLVAVGIQMVDWGETGKSVLNGLASVMDFLSQHSDILTASLIGLSTALASVSISAGIVKINKMIEAYGGLKKVLDVLSKKFNIFAGILSGLLFNKFTKITAIVTGLVYGFGKLSEYLKDKTGFDISFGLWDKLTDLIKRATNALKDFFNVSSTENADKISEFLDDVDHELGVLAMKTSAYARSNEKDILSYLKYLDLLDEAYRKGIDPKETQGLFGRTVDEELMLKAKEWVEYEQTIAQSKKRIEDQKQATEKAREEVERLAKAWDDVRNSINKAIGDINFEKEHFAADPYSQDYQRTLYDMMNKSLEQGIDLSSLTDSGITKQEELENLAKGYADAAEELRFLQETTMTYTQKIDFAKSATKGFFSDMKQGLAEGKSAWESFGDAALNVMNKITDKMMDLGIDMLYAGMQAYFGGGGITSSGGSISSGWTSSGGLQGSSVHLTAAKGHAFSNGVVDSPTLFAFAKGGSFGVMGEAGPEAVMPLTRGPDGSLGVRADGVGSGSNVVVNVINNSDSQARTEQRQTEQGTEIDVIIDKMVADKMSQPGTSSNSALRAFNNQQLVMR